MPKTNQYARWQGGVFTTRAGSQYEFNELKDNPSAVKNIAGTIRDRRDRRRFQHLFELNERKARKAAKAELREPASLLAFDTSQDDSRPRPTEQTAEA